jgi:two-component system, sensor histidine kinase and response regulator
MRGRSASGSPSVRDRLVESAAASTNNAPLILVADDVAANVELLFDQLHVLGFRALAASDGPSALAACFEHRPELCILDVSMPAGDLGVDDRSTGFEVCRRIKRDPRTKSIPVIFVTALNDTTDRVKAIEAGGDDFLTKPHNRLVLGARVRSLLKLKAATDSLEDTLRKLREVEKMRDDLMKMIVHDLKTPLTSVLASMEMLIDGDFGALNADQRKMLSDAEGKAEDLLALIGDLLEVSRIEEATMKLDIQQIAPAALLNEVVHEWSIRFQQEAATAHVDVADDAPVFQADKALLKRVLGNLVQNALTHSAKAVTLQMSARREGDGILFTITDNGPGIPPEYHEVIFRKFERVKNPNIPRTRSSGLGLAFCKLVVDAHGGRIWVQSAGEGKGSSFHFVLPIVPAHREVRVSASGVVPV